MSTVATSAERPPVRGRSGLPFLPDDQVPVGMDGIRIAVVDDDPLYLEYVSGLLAVQGFRRVQCLGAGAGLARALREIEADCLLIDNDLGRDNGFNVAMRMMQERSDPPPVVMMTGAGSERAAVKAFRLGFSDYVSKRNLTSSELALAVQGAVARGSEVRDAGDDPGRGADGLGNVAHMRGTLATFAAQTSRRAFAALMIAPRDPDALARRVGLVAADRASRHFVRKLREEAGPLGFLGRWTEGRFMLLSDAIGTPDDLERLCADLAPRLEVETACEGTRARLPAVLGAVLQPPHAVDPDRVAMAVEAALDDARQRGVAHAIARGSAGSVTRPAHARCAPAPVPVPKEEERRNAASKREQRGERRMRCLKRARILLHEIGTVVDAVVVDRSARGLGLRALGYLVAPDRFEIEVLGSGRHEVDLRWQVGGRLGVQIAGAGL